MSYLSLKHISKIYPNGLQAVNDFNLEVDEHDFIILVGPSGCGKSTTLRMIAGLENITEGELFINDQKMNDVESKDRDIAMVFQNYALYPHMTVFENMAFGLKVRKVSKPEIKEQVLNAAKILDLTDLLNRKPSSLSGGQKQRVAMGRAIVRNPKIFLMDEPLSNLDARLRIQMRSEISKLYNRLNSTIIYVTHDQTEAMTLGTKIIVLKDGVIQQSASPFELYNNPANTFVAKFIGSPSMNLFNGYCQEMDDQLIINISGNVIVLPYETSNILKSKSYVSKEIIVGIRPEDISEADYYNSTLFGIVNNYELLGSESYVYADFDDTSIAVRLPANECKKTGERFHMKFNLDKLHFFDVDTKEAIIN